MVSVGFFRRLAFLTAFFAYLQIALGGVVRVTGSGLGCPDWPLCHGRPYPAADIHSIIEYSHRSVGTITGVLLIGTVALAWVVFRQRRPLVAWLATASLVAIAAEGALGGVVVANELASWLVLVHLGLAMIILGFLIATAVMSLPASTGASDPSFRRLAAVATALTYGLLLTGSTVVASSADEGCRAWPLCASAVLVIGAVLVYTLIQALRHPATKAAALATLVVLGLQVAVGAGAAVTGAALFNGLHVAMATLVWAGMLSIALVTLPRADRRPALSRLAVDKRPA